MNSLSAHSSGFTLIELLVVASLLAILSIAGVTAFTTARDNQLVRQRAEMVGDTFRRASIYSQNARDERTWGVKSDDQKQYTIISQETGGAQFPELQAVTLPEGIRFSEPFLVWFTRGTGHVDENIQVVLTTSHNSTSIVKVFTTGTITVTSP